LIYINKFNDICQFKIHAPCPMHHALYPEH
jgi:hypothetical protein